MSQAEEYLSARGITAADAEAAGLWDEPDASATYPDFRAAPAIIIPYFDVAGEPVAFTRDGEELPFCRIRYLGAAAPRGKKALRYTQPADSGSRAYFPLGGDWARIAMDPSEPLIITEGEIKAIKAGKEGLPCIALGGVYNFNRGGGFLPELVAWAWEGREVYIVFDSDAAENPNVMAAESRLVDELQLRRGAKCRLVRLAPGPDGEKMGLDDFLVTHGVKAFLELVESATDLYALDAKVISLNRHIAWIERESKVYDLDGKFFFAKDSLLSGGQYSTLTHIVPAEKAGAKPKVIQVARTWLTHPHAQRFNDVLFRPGEGPTVTSESGGVALNLFTGWDSRPGDVTPFLDLTEWVFSRLPEEHRDLCLKTVAYKMQNPQLKVGLCPVLVGSTGSGKSLWLQLVKEAFGAYGEAATSKSFVSDFRGWLERTLFVAVNEAEAVHLEAGKDVLKSLITDLPQAMNEKYRVATQVNHYAMYAICGNDPSIGSFAADDRRMIVVGCPGEHPDGWSFYEPIWAFQRAGGGRVLAHYLLNLDLKGWKPPIRAPITAEKAMAHREGLSPIQAIAYDCLTGGEHRVRLFLDTAVGWGAVNEQSGNPQVAQQALATMEAAKQWQVRDWYTPDELTAIFPMVIGQLGGKFDRSTAAGALSRALRAEGIPFLECKDNPEGFRWNGRVQQFLVLANFGEWNMPITQADFERQMAGWPRYGAGRRGAK